MREHFHLGDLARVCPAQHTNVIVVDQRIVQCVALIEELEDRLGQARTFGDAITLGHRSCADISNDAFDGNHFQRDDQRIALVEQSHEMGRDVRLGELAHNVGIDPIVGLAFLCELGNLRAVECARVVPEMHDQ